MMEQVRILTYDSIPTDLAGEMKGWEEFVSGEGYSVRLRDGRSGDEVTVYPVRSDHERVYSNFN